MPKRFTAAVLFACSLAGAMAVMGGLNWCDYVTSGGFWSYYFNCPAPPPAAGGGSSGAG